MDIRNGGGGVLPCLCHRILLLNSHVYAAVTNKARLYTYAVLSDILVTGTAK